LRTPFAADAAARTARSRLISPRRPFHKAARRAAASIEIKMNRILSGALALVLLATPIHALAHETAAHSAPAAAAPAGPVVTVGDLEISGAFSRATLPNAPVGAGYLTITNTGGADDTLVSATSPVAGMTQIHQMKMEGDVMKMSEMGDGLVIPAGQSVVLAPGGLHIMFMDLNAPLVEGSKVALTLAFATAGTVEVELAVGPINADAPACEGADH
jgi:copper(I)-binding protein